LSTGDAKSGTKSDTPKSSRVDLQAIAAWMDTCPVKLSADAKAEILNIVEGGTKQG